MQLLSMDCIVYSSIQSTPSMDLKKYLAVQYCHGGIRRTFRATHYRVGELIVVHTEHGRIIDIEGKEGSTGHRCTVHRGPRARESAAPPRLVT